MDKNSLNIVFDNIIIDKISNVHEIAPNFTYSQES